MYPSFKILRYLMKKDIMGRACGMHGGSENCVPVFFIVNPQRKSPPGKRQA
jgi:hypothetical protein